MEIDLLVEGGLIRTVDESHPTATRMAVLNGSVVALDEETDGLRPRRRLRLGGATVVPGFNDAHCHPVFLGSSLAELDLSHTSCPTLDDIYQRVAEQARATPPGGWIVGSLYDQNKLGAHPTRAALDDVAPEHFVWLKHTSAHMCVVNSRVLQAAGLINGAATVPQGGVVHLESGRIEEQAQRLVRDLVLPMSDEQVAAALARASSLALTEGVTSWTAAGLGGGWIGNSAREISAYQFAQATGRLPIRTTVMVAADCLHDVRRHRDDTGDIGLDLGIRTGLGDDRLRIGAVKVFTDGSLVGRTAAMCSEYYGEEGNRGYLQDAEETLKSRIVGAHLAGWQVASHAIGDRAVDLVLDAIAEAHAAHPRPLARHRIEHAGVVSDAQVREMARLGVIAVPQGEFLSALGDGMVAAVGSDRVASLYRQRSFLDVGVIVPGSSDRPVVPGAPLTGIRDLVLRQTASGVVLAPEERLDAAEALRAWTFGSAHAEHTEGHKGTLAAGMLADFVVLDGDPCVAAPETISDIEVEATYIGGQAAFVR